MAYVILNTCNKNAACVAECPVDCIYEGEGQYFINPDECIDCDACVPVCPTQSVFPEDSVPENATSAIAANRAFFGL